MMVINNVDKVVDSLGRGIDPGIKTAVGSFNKAGFETSASCEGHLGHGSPSPWIEVVVNNKIDGARKYKKLSFMANKFNKRNGIDPSHSIKVYNYGYAIRVSSLSDSNLGKFMLAYQKKVSKPKAINGEPLKDYLETTQGLMGEFSDFLVEEG